MIKAYANKWPPLDAGKLWFRGLTDEGTWEYGGIVRIPRGQYFITTLTGGSDVKPETVGQFTGLYDNTTWDELASDQKELFWKCNRSEDGKSIKYQEIDDVKHLWKGNPIFEGDILQCQVKDWENDGYKHVNKAMEWWESYCYNGYRLRSGKATMQAKPSSLKTMKVKVIGNIYQNPDLLKEG